MQIRIYYEDTDCGGIVYHTNYLKYCERARSGLFFRAGLLPNTQKLGLVVRKIEAEFLDSARLGDLLFVATKIQKLGKTSVVLEQKIFLQEALDGRLAGEMAAQTEGEMGGAIEREGALRLAKNERLIFSATVKLACVDIAARKIAQIPAEFLGILEGFMADSPLDSLQKIGEDSLGK